MDDKNKITPEMWKKWYSHKSNKERWIEQEETNPYRHIEEVNEENYKAVKE